MSNVARKHQLDLWDRVLDGNLTAMLTGWRKDGLGFAEMSHLLYKEHDINVVPETVRRWLTEIDLRAAR